MNEEASWPVGRPPAKIRRSRASGGRRTIPGDGAQAGRAEAAEPDQPARGARRGRRPSKPGRRPRQADAGGDEDERKAKNVGGRVGERRPAGTPSFRRRSKSRRDGRGRAARAARRRGKKSKADRRERLPTRETSTPMSPTVPSASGGSIEPAMCAGPAAIAERSRRPNHWRAGNKARPM